MSSQVEKLRKQALGKRRSHVTSAVRKLEKLAGPRRKTRDEAVAALRDVALKGQESWFRTEAIFALSHVAVEGDEEAAQFFRENLYDRDLRYGCCALGLLKTVGAAAYPDLIPVLNDSTAPISDRCQIVMNISEASGHPFDRRRPPPFCDWTEEDLLLDEINAWAEGGYQPPPPAATEIPKEVLEELKEDLPEDCLAFLSAHSAGVEVVHAGNPWRFPKADDLLEQIVIDGRKATYLKQLASYAATLKEIFEGNETVDGKGNAYPILRLVEGLALAGDDCGDVLYLDPADGFSVWIFHHDGGDVERVGRSLKGWLARSKKLAD